MALAILERLKKSDIDKKTAEIENNFKKSTADQAEVREHISGLESDLKKARLEAALEGSDAARRQIDALAPRISKLREKDSDLTKDIEAQQTVLAMLSSRRAAAEKGEVELRFKTECDRLIAIAKSIDPMIQSFAVEARKGAAQAGVLQGITLPHVHGLAGIGDPICRDSFDAALAATLAHWLTDSLRQGRLQVGEFESKEAGKAEGSLASFLKKRLEFEQARLHRGLEARTPSSGSPEDVSVEELVLAADE